MSIDRFRRDTARRLRHDATDWERKLWWHLERIAVADTHFRRQVPIGPYIVDFASHRLRLVIEVDGAQHGERRHRIGDRVRDRWLGERGYRVLRFWNDDVKLSIDSVLDTIVAAVEERQRDL